LRIIINCLCKKRVKNREKFSCGFDQLQSARDSLERIKSNASATTQAIDELNQILREFEQYLPKATRDIEPTVTRAIERDSDGNISIEPKRRGIGR
jgi:hypothetical protein